MIGMNFGINAGRFALERNFDMAIGKAAHEVCCAT
jgi:hypothetical protein